MTKKLLVVKKLMLIILCAAVLKLAYYLTMVRPFDEFWAETKAILSGELRPDTDHPLWGDYHLDLGKPYSQAASVKLDISRYFVWRWGNHGGMIVDFSQEYYDEEGNLLVRNYSGEKWTLEKIDGKWTITEMDPGLP